MKAQYAKITIQVILISLLAFLLIGCSGDSSHHGDGDDTASISMSASSTEVPADGSGSTAITATLTNSSGEAVEKGTDVSFSTDIGRFESGQKTHSVSTTGDSGSVTVSLMSDERTGDTIVKATSNGVTQSVKVTFVEGGIAEAAYLSVGTSTNTVKTDNSDSAEITAVVLDKSRAPIEGISVDFTTISEDGKSGAGQLSDSSMVTETHTDEKGQEVVEAVVQFSAGVGDKRNQVVTVVAAVEGLAPKQVPIQVQGTRVELETEGSTDLEAGVGSSTLKIIVKDASENEVFDAPVEVSLAPESTGVVAIDPGTGRTDKNGEIRVTVSGLGVGEAIVKAESLGASATQTYMVDDPNKVFQIIDPAEDVVAASTNEGRRITVRSPGIEKVTFASTIGGWDANGEKVIEKSVADNKASAVFHSADAGTATIQVYASEDTSLTDSMKIAVSATASEARKVDLQADQNVVMPSTEQAENSVTLRAKVKNAGNQVVGNAPVLFRIQNPIGGGEYVSPAIAYTDNSGIAKSTFTSGSLVAGADGVTITAELINRDVSDDVYIVIGGESASVTMGRSTEVESINNDTSYKLPMSVLVTDANGSPVEDAKVTLNLFPSHYRVGDWESREVWENDKLETICVPIVDGTRPNEDTNKNLILDEGEDINQDGQLTPPMPSAGEAPDVVTTDENGVANFNLIYLKAYAAWVKDEITASTLVSGTETSTTYHFVLPWSESDADECNLPDSPFFFEETESEIDSIEVGNSGTDQIVGDGNSRATIRATVKANDGSGIGGKTVEFSTTLGSFTSGTTKTTDENGVATIILRSEKALGTAVVTANASGFTDKVEVEFVGGPPASITVAAIPTTVPPNEPSTIVATLRDEHGNPVEGETVNFKLTNNNSAADQLSPSAETNVNGQATVSYTAGEDEGTDQVQAIADSNQSIKNSTYISVDTGVSVIGSITLNADPTQIPADGTSSSAIKATLTDSSGEPMPEGTSVLFETTLGQFSTSGWQSTSRSVVGENGEVSVSLISGTQGGTATVTATSGGVSQSTTVTFEGTGDGDGDGDDGGDGGTGIVGSIDLISGADQIEADGNSQVAIRATVTDTETNPLSGVDVVFNTTLGSWDGDSTVPTDANGVAEVMLQSGTTAGTATVTANASGFRSSVNVEFVSGAPAGLVLNASPEIIYPGESSELTVSLTDDDGKPVANETIAFMITSNQSGGSLSTTSATTDINGQVSIIYTAGVNNGDDIIAARSTTQTGVTDDVEIVVGGQVSLTANPETIEANGTDTSTFTATVLNNAGDPIPDVPVVFKDITGEDLAETGTEGFTGSGISDTAVFSHGGGTMTFTMSHDGSSNFIVELYDSNGNYEGLIKNAIGTVDNETSTVQSVPEGDYYLSVMADGEWAIDVETSTGEGIDSLDDFDKLPTLAVKNTNASGQATYDYTSSKIAKAVNIGIKAGEVLAEATLEQVAGAPANVDVYAAPSTVNPGSNAAITAKVTDTNDNAVSGETVTFSITDNQSGASLGATSAVTDLSGEAVVSYTAGSTNGVQDEVTATADGIPGTATIDIDASAVMVGGITVETGSDTLPANGASGASIRATVTDVDGEALPGIGVEFITTLGSITSPITTDANGVAQTTLTASDKTGTATVTAIASGFRESVVVEFLPSHPQSIILEAMPSTVNTGDTSIVTATLVDNGSTPPNPVAGETIRFSFDENQSGANLSAPSAVTNINGEATVTYTAGSATGTDKIYAVSATNGEIDSYKDITVSSSASTVAIQSLSLTPNDTEIVANGSSTTAIRAKVMGVDGNPVSGETVAFDTSYGSLSAINVSTSETGVAEVILTSAPNTGLSVITASIASEGVSDQVKVNFVPGPPIPGNSSITVQPASIPADGTSEAEATVTLADANGNPVLDGTSVSLYSSMGTITSANPVPTASGRATFTIQAPTTTGTADLYLWDYPLISGSLGFGTITSGDPSSILIESVSSSEISVTGVGKTDNTSVTVRVVDETGSTISNASEDYALLVELLAKPDGGESLSGEDPDGDLTSDSEEIIIGLPGGETAFNLKSGILPGVVEIRLEVLDQTVSPPASLSPPVVTVSPQISIASGPPHSMALSAPSLDAVVNLNEGGEAGIPQTPGFYSRKAGLIVTDKYGNAVPDGTTINLGVIDSVISSGDTGSITNGDAQLTDIKANFGDDSITRGGLVREIEPNDRLVLFDVVAADKSRFVTTPIGVTTLPVTKSYTNTANNIEYAVGASELGATIYGTDGSTATKGTVQTENGLGQLRLVYPANKNRILVGWHGDPTIDTRHQPAGSARVITVFTSSDEKVSMVDEGTLCFSPIADFTLEAVPEELFEDGDIKLSLVDGGDEVPLPFVEVTSTYTIDTGSGPIDISYKDPDNRTDEDGFITSTIEWTTASSGDSATITYYAGDAKAEVTYEVP